MNDNQLRFAIDKTPEKMVEIISQVKDPKYVLYSYLFNIRDFSWNSELNEEAMIQMRRAYGIARYWQEHGIYPLFMNAIMFYLEMGTRDGLNTARYIAKGDADPGALRSHLRNALKDRSEPLLRYLLLDPQREWQIRELIHQVRYLSREDLETFLSMGVPLPEGMDDAIAYARTRHLPVDVERAVRIGDSDTVDAYLEGEVSDDALTLLINIARETGHTNILLSIVAAPSISLDRKQRVKAALLPQHVWDVERVQGGLTEWDLITMANPDNNVEETVALANYMEKPDMIPLIRYLMSDKDGASWHQYQLLDLFSPRERTRRQVLGHLSTVEVPEIRNYISSRSFN